MHSDIIDLGLTWSNKEATKTLAVHQRGQAITGAIMHQRYINSSERDEK